MAGDNAETHQETGKPALTTTSALKYLLNRAATVDEAVELLRGIDMHSDIGSAHHYAIAAVSSPEDSHGSQGTVWTTLMDLTHPSIIYWSRRHFDKPFQFEIGDISQ